MNRAAKRRKSKRPVKVIGLDIKTTEPPKDRPILIQDDCGLSIAKWWSSNQLKHMGWLDYPDGFYYSDQCNGPDLKGASLALVSDDRQPLKVPSFTEWVDVVNLAWTKR